MKLPEFDLVDIRILECLYRSTNLSEIARRVGVTDETVRRRVRKLYKYGRVTVEPDYFAMGLSYGIYLSENQPQDLPIKASLLRRCYVLSVTRLISPEGPRSLFVLVPPIHLEGEILSIVKSLFSTGTYLPLLNPIKWRPSSKYFDAESREYICPWDKIERTLISKSPIFDIFDQRLVPQILDEVDLEIIKELHKDALTPLAKVARMLGTYPQKVWYHYINHVKPIIRHYDINMTFTSLEEIPLSLYRIDFMNIQYMMHFVSVMLENIHIRVMIPFRYRPSMLMLVQMPYNELLPFVDLLGKLKAHRKIRHFKYEGFIDSRYIQAFTIPHGSEVFKNGKWILSEELLDILQSLRPRARGMELERSLGPLDESK